MTAHAIIEAHGDGVWLIRVERRVSDHTASGEARVRQEGQPDGSAPPHVGLAASRAWQALAEQRLVAGDVTAAIASAQSGLQELGTSYAPPLVRDDTKLKLAAAEQRIAEGHDADGAEVLLRTLAARQAMYVQRYRAELAEENVM